MAYPFRAGAAKAILAVRNDVLERSANPTKELSAALINALAVLDGIQLHLIEPLDYTPKAPADFKSGGAVVGFGQHTLFGLDAVQKKTRQVVGGTQEQRDKLQLATDDNDLGADLVESAGGYVFDVNAWVRGNAGEQKKWLAVVAAALADRLARTEVRLNCHCRLRGGLWPVDDCVLLDTKLKGPIVSAGGGVRCVYGHNWLIRFSFVL